MAKSHVSFTHFPECHNVMSKLGNRYVPCHYIFSLAPMSLNRMSQIKFKKCPCHAVDFRGQEAFSKHACRGPFPIRAYSLPPPPPPPAPRTPHPAPPCVPPIHHQQPRGPVLRCALAPVRGPVVVVVVGVCVCVCRVRAGPHSNHTPV